MTIDLLYIIMYSIYDQYIILYRVIHDNISLHILTHKKHITRYGFAWHHILSHTIIYIKMKKHKTIYKFFY